MKVDVAMAPEPPVILGLVRIQVVQNDVDFLAEVLCNYIIHKVEKLSTATARVMSRFH